MRPVALLSWALAAPILAEPVPAPGPHARQAARPPRIPELPGRPPLDGADSPPPDVWVYGYFATWAGDLEDLAWERLTHVAVFNVDLNEDGTLSGETLWWSYGPRAVDLAAPHGVKVHLTLTCFEDSVMREVLPDPTLRAAVVSRLGELVDGAGADGVSVDCEGMSASLKADLVSFVEELSNRVDEVTVATPAIDWSGAYDYDQLAYASDALFIMGYGYHWSGGNPGPNAPLYGGSPWSEYSLEWSVEDYRYFGAPSERIILGLPLYGHEWPTTDTDVPGTATGSGDAVVMVDAMAQAGITGREYDELTETPYTFPSSRSQTWYDDTESLRPKIRYAVDEGLKGVGFWALNYEGSDPEFWQMVADETVLLDEDTASPGGDGGGNGRGDGGDGDEDADSGWADTGALGRRWPGGKGGCSTVPMGGAGALAALLLLLRRRR